MDKLLRGFITVEKFTQVAALVGVIVLLSYLGFSHYGRVPSSTSVPSQTIQ